MAGALTIGEQLLELPPDQAQAVLPRLLLLWSSKLALPAAADTYLSQFLASLGLDAGTPLEALTAQLAAWGDAHPLSAETMAKVSALFAARGVEMERWAQSFAVLGQPRFLPSAPAASRNTFVALRAQQSRKKNP